MSKTSKKEACLVAKNPRQHQLIEDLKKDIESYKLRCEQTEKKLQHVLEEYNKLTQSFLDAQRQRFGKRSERFIDSNQLSLFGSTDKQGDKTDSESDEKDTDEDENKETITYTRDKKGNKDGVSRQWYENGQLEWEENYKNGVVISGEYFDEEGNEKPSSFKRKCLAGVRLPLLNATALLADG